MKRAALLLVFVSLSAFAAKARTVYLSETDMASIRVVPGRSTILSFPIKPNKVILGNQGMFAVEYVENDLALAALRGEARGNLFVYMEGRRFAFDLSTVSSSGDEIILVRDVVEMPVRGKNGKGSIKR
jgi:hypothetical protein